jgi:DnaK suppressor protein
MATNLTGPRPLPVAGAAGAGRGSAQPAVGPRSGARSLPHWRTLLEARWRVRLRQVTELSLAFHDAAAVVSTGGAGGGDPADPDDPADPADPARRRVRELLRRTVEARRGLADVEEALARLEEGRFGRCEQCAAAIPAATLARAQEARYCPGCAGRWLSGL